VSIIVRVSYNFVVYQNPCSALQHFTVYFLRNFHWVTLTTTVFSL